MIVLDEQLGWGRVQAAIKRWYPGSVITVHDFEPHKRVPDQALPRYLLRLRQPTLVTINYNDFQPRIFVHPKYCVIRLRLTQEEALFVPPILRSILLEPQFNTKAKRMGKVISWTKEGGIDFVEV